MLLANTKAIVCAAANVSATRQERKQYGRPIFKTRAEEQASALRASSCSDGGHRASLDEETVRRLRIVRPVHLPVLQRYTGAAGGYIPAGGLRSGGADENRHRNAVRRCCQASEAG